MAAKKSTKTATKAALQEVLSDKEIVLKKFKNAVCEPVKTGFCVLDNAKDGSPIHSGLAKTKENAWKLAARAVL